MNKLMTEVELQHLEHCNKVLIDHQILVKEIVNSTELVLNNYVPILKTYVDSIIEIQKTFSDSVVDIIRSTRQLKVVASNSQEISNYIQAVIKLTEILSREDTQKVLKLIKEI